MLPQKLYPQQKSTSLLGLVPAVISSLEQRKMGGSNCAYQNRQTLTLKVLEK